MPDETLHIASNVDGFPLTVYRWRAATPDAIVVIAHGAAEHALRYERFARALNAAGFDTWAPDHRGHGNSPGPEGLGDFGEGGWDALVADIGQVVTLAKAALPGLPAVLFGHSMGASASQQFAPDGSRMLEALVLSGSTLREPPPPGTEFVMPNLNEPFEPGRTKYDWLSRDEAEVDRYIADPCCGFEIWKDGVRVRNRADPAVLGDLERLRRIRPDLPVLLLAGDADPVNRNLEGLRYLESRWREAGVQRIDRLFYPGGRHEMLNETNRDEVTADTVAWLRGVVGRG